MELIFLKALGEKLGKEKREALSEGIFFLFFIIEIKRESLIEMTIKNLKGEREKKKKKEEIFRLEIRNDVLARQNY